MSDEQKYINKARDYANKNNKTGLVHFLKENDYYKSLSEYCRKHYLKTIMKFFNDDLDFDSLLLLEELNDWEEK